MNCISVQAGFVSLLQHNVYRGYISLFGVLVCIAAAGCGATPKTQAAASEAGSLQGSRLFQLARHCILEDRDGVTSLSKNDWIKALGETRDPYVFDTLATVLEGNIYAASPAEAAEALSMIDDPRVYGVLEKAARAKHIDMMCAVRAMANHANTCTNGELATKYVLSQLANNSDEDVRSTAAIYLWISGRARPDIVAAFGKAAKGDSSTFVRAILCCRLFETAPAEYLPMLQRFQTDKDARVREEIAFRIPYTCSTMPIVWKLFEDDNVEVAAAAWEELEKALGDEESALFTEAMWSTKEGRQAACLKYKSLWEQSRR